MISSSSDEEEVKILLNESRPRAYGGRVRISLNIRDCHR